jgi:2-C-methyl-D-erythritol 4-phosphate cytidylyltransferase
VPGIIGAGLKKREINKDLHNNDLPELYREIQSVPLSKHTVSVIKTSWLMLYSEIIAVCSEIHTKQINTLCGQNVELVNVKLAVHIVTTGL